MIKDVLIILLVLITACRQNSPEENLKRFVDDPGNKITQTIVVGDVGIVTKFLPESYRSLMVQDKDSIQHAGDQFYYFDIKFNKMWIDKPSKEKLLYLNFDMQDDFVLLANNRDSVAPAICQKIENGISSNYEYMVVFEKGGPEKWDDFTLLYHDKVFGIGTVAFAYQEEDILKIPGINEKK